MIGLRKAEPILVYGQYDLLLENDTQIYAYTRSLDEQQLLIICNLTSLSAQYNHPDDLPASEHLLLSNYSVAPHEAINSLALGPFEARIYRLFKA
jgi:alpha-glucosidase